MILWVIEGMKWVILNELVMLTKKNDHVYV